MLIFSDLSIGYFEKSNFKNLKKLNLYRSKKITDKGFIKLFSNKKIIEYLNKFVLARTNFNESILKIINERNLLSKNLINLNLRKCLKVNDNFIEIISQG